MNGRSDTFWLSYMSTSIVWALAHDKPKPHLKQTLREFLADRPKTDPVAVELRRTLAERKR